MVNVSTEAGIRAVILIGDSNSDIVGGVRLPGTLPTGAPDQTIGAMNNPPHRGSA